MTLEIDVRVLELGGKWTWVVCAERDGQLLRMHTRSGTAETGLAAIDAASKARRIIERELL